MQHLYCNTNHVVHLHHDRRRRRSVIRLTQKRRNSLSSFLLQRVAPSWRTITLLVVLFLGNNDHQNGTPSISFVRAKGFHHPGSSGGASSSSSSSSSSSTVMMDHPLLVPQLHASNNKQQHHVHHHHHNRWSSTKSKSATAAAVLDVAPMNLTEVVSRVCPGGGSSTPTRTHHQHQHHNRHQKTSPSADIDDSSTTTTTTSIDSTTTTSTSSSSKYTFSLYQPGDLSDVHPDGIPDRYMRMQNNNVEKARKALANSLQFRQEHDVDTILGRPHAKYDQCKAVFPHYLLGRTPDQEHVIFLQRPALVQLPLAQQLNLTIDDLLMHYVYVFEYIWNILEGNHSTTTTTTSGGASNATMVSLIDLTGLDMGLLRRPELLKLVQRFVSMIDAHYPQRAHITMLLNAPKWFGALYRIISPILRESTKAKIKILSNGQEQEDMLVKYLGQDVVHNVLPQELRKRQRHHKKRKKHHQQQQENKQHQQQENKQQHENKQQQKNKQQQEDKQPQKHHRRRGWGNKHQAPPPITTTEVEVETSHTNNNNEVKKELEVIHAAATAAATAEEVEPAPVHVAAFNGQSTPLEVELRNFCLERLQEAGQEMMPVV